MSNIAPWIPSIGAEISVDISDCSSEVGLSSHCCRWCHRIFPVQATCSLTKGDLCAVVMQLVKDYLGNRKTNTDQPLKVTAVLFYFWYLSYAVSSTHQTRRPYGPNKSFIEILQFVCGF